MSDSLFDLISIEPDAADAPPAPAHQAHTLEIEPDPVEAPATTAADDLATATIVDILPPDFPLPVLTRFVPNPAIRAAVQDAAAAALAVDVTAPGGLEAADQAVATLRGAIAAAEAHFADPARIAHDLHRSVTGTRGEWTRPGVEALATMAQRIVAENDRIERDAAAERRRLQDEANERARAAAAADADQAAQADAPAAVVQEMREAARTAVAPPVPSPRSVGGLQHSTVKRTWKARLVGTPADAENPNPDSVDLTPPQRAAFLTLLRAVLDGKAPIAAVSIEWGYLNKRAAADKSAMGIPGLEAFQVGGLRGKAGR